MVWNHHLAEISSWMDHPCTWIFLRCSEVSCFKIYVPHNCQRVLSGKHIYSHDFFVESTVDGRNPALVGRSCGAGLLHQQYHTLLQVNPRLWQRNSTQLEINQFSSQKSFGWGKFKLPKTSTWIYSDDIAWSPCGRWIFVWIFPSFTPKVSTHGLLLTQRALELEIGPTASRCERVWFGGWWVQSGPQKTVINWATTCYNSYK